MKLQIKSSVIIILHIFFLCFVQKVFAQNELEFKDKDRVAFIGNSITAAGLYHMNVQTYYQTRFPDRKIEFFNCGVPGDITTKVLARMKYDILPLKPTVALIKLGMNDAGGSFYEKKYTKDELLKEQNRIVEKYRNEMTEIIKMLRAECNPRLFLIKSTPYDSNFKMANKIALVGKNETIQKLGLVVDELAKEYGATVIDFYNPLNDLNTKQQQIDSNFTTVGKDRVHPGPMGHLMMAYLLLKAQHVSEVISKIELKKCGKIGKNTSNVTISNFKKNTNVISFNAIENALPFPIPSDAVDALKYMPINDLNKESLKIKGLSKGIYKIEIDNIEIGKFSSKELLTGINYGSIANTPQQKQAFKVLERIKSAYNKRVTIRTMLLAKIMLATDKIDITNSEMLKSYVDEKCKLNPYYGIVVNTYMENKDKTAEIEASIQKDLDEARILSQPLKHNFKIIKN